MQTFCFNSLAINNKKAFAETSPVEPDAVNTAVGKSLQLPYIFTDLLIAIAFLSCAVIGVISSWHTMPTALNCYAFNTLISAK